MTGSPAAETACSTMLPFACKARHTVTGAPVTGLMAGCMSSHVKFPDPVESHTPPVSRRHNGHAQELHVSLLSGETTQPPPRELGSMM